MGKYDVREVAKYFLHKSPMTQKKLHKMLFFTYGWYLFENNEKDNLTNFLFTPSIEKHGFQAWVHGPVFRELYPIYANYGFREIYNPNDNSSIFQKEDKELIDEVFDAYIDYSADQLETMSHSFKSWQKARGTHGPYDVCKEVIKDTDIYQDIEDL